MARKPTGNPNGRPLVEIEWGEFDTLCAVQATLSEIAGYFDCSEDTIENAVKREQGVTFSEYFAKKRVKGLISLRRRQFQAAMAGNTRLLTHLGEQYLGQASKRDITSGGEKIRSGVAEVRVYQLPDNGRAIDAAALTAERMGKNGNGGGRG